MSELSARLGLPFIISGQGQKDLTHNEALALIDGGLSPCAEAIGMNSAPSTPIVGQTWIVGASPTGLWSGQAGALALWTEGGWRFLGPVDGMRVWLKDQSLWATHFTGGWTVGEEPVSRLLVDGVPVVGSRGASVQAPSGGVTIDSEARSTLESIIARLEAHGLIAPAS